MASFRECLVAGGRAYVDAGDVAAVIVRGDDFESLAAPEKPIRLLLSGCGDTVDIFGTSIADLVDGWLDPDKFVRLRCTGGHVFLHVRHVVGVQTRGDSDSEPSHSKAPLRVLMRGVGKTIDGWGLSAIDFLLAMQQKGREVRVTYPHRTAA